jgi:hypothetical protein
MTDINDIWSDDEDAEHQRQNMDPLALRMMQMAMNQRRLERQEKARDRASPDRPPRTPR